jgi:asparagine synthase (glutamine-hydrolysing)
MANFLVAVDFDPRRRARLVQEVDPLIAPLSGLHTKRCSVDHFTAIWAAGDRAPVDHITADTDAAIVLGEAIGDQGPQRLTATDLMRLWLRPAGKPPTPLDGFHAAIVYRRDGGLLAAADLLGLFPVYYWASAEVLLVGSSQELFRYHPSFRVRLNPAGLVGILLTNGLVDGQTLWSGVRRLAPGHRLEWTPGAPTREVQQFRIPASSRYFDLPFTTHVKLLGDAMEHAIQRHAPAGRRYGLLLSGGLDSRMLGGYLKERRVETDTLTLGIAHDIETQSAARVARALGYRQRTAEIPDARYPELANLAVKWEHLANGFSHVMGWGIRPFADELPSPVVTGLVMDSIIGPHLLYNQDSTQPTAPFDHVLAFYNSWGVRLDWLNKLLRPEVFEGIVPDMIDRLRNRFEDYADLPSQRAWCFQLHHRARFHVGSSAWQLAFAAWPQIPAAAANVLEVAGGMPPSTLANRRAQVALLCGRFPELAALPLDRNSYDTTPLQPRLRWLLRDYLRGRLRPAAKLVPNALRRERRRFYRTFDINNAGWRAVRRAAEPYRSHVHHLFNADALNAFLPAPDDAIVLRDGIIDSAGLKQILGFLLWSRDHL